MFLDHRAIKLFFIICFVNDRTLGDMPKPLSSLLNFLHQSNTQPPKPKAFDEILFPNSTSNFSRPVVNYKTKAVENNTIIFDDGMVKNRTEESLWNITDKEYDLGVVPADESDVVDLETTATNVQQKIHVTQEESNMETYCNLTCRKKLLNTPENVNSFQDNVTEIERWMIQNYQWCKEQCIDAYMLETTTQVIKVLKLLEQNFQHLPDKVSETVITESYETVKVTEPQSLVTFSELGTTKVTTKMTTELLDLVNTTPNVNTTEEELNNIIEDLSHMLHNNSPVLIQDLKNQFGRLDEFLNPEEEVGIPSTFLNILDQAATRIDLNGLQVGSVVQNNFAIVMADARPDAPVRGFRVKVTESDDMFNSSDLEIINDESPDVSKENNEAIVYLPECVANSSRRISFLVFRNDRAFRIGNKGRKYIVNSKVISVNIENVTEFKEGEVIDIYFRPKSHDSERACAYWHFNDDETGYWSNDGCNLIKATQNDTLDICRCDHLTHFAEVLVPGGQFSKQHEDVLEILSLIGCSLSLLGLFIIGLTAALFDSWRRDFGNKIWLQLSFAILVVIICFMIIVFAEFDQFTTFCFVTGIMLHYFVLASFCWMSVGAVLSYLKLVVIFKNDGSHKLLKASLFSWGSPFVVVGILLLVSPDSYSGRFNQDYQGNAFCYPSELGLLLAVYLPVSVALLVNLTLFCLIVRSIFFSAKIQKHSNSNEALHSVCVSCLLLFLFGLPWLFGLFAYNIIAAFLFSLTATFQGFVLFLFFIIANRKTRRLWCERLGMKHISTSSNVDSNSSRRFRRVNPSDETEIEVKFSSVYNEPSSPFLPHDTINDQESLNRPHLTEFSTFKPDSNNLNRRIIL